MHEICMIRCNFTKKRTFEKQILPINFEDGGTQEWVKPFFVLADGLRLFAMRLPSLSQGMVCGDCGITFDIFTHVLAQVCFFLFFFLFISFTTIFLKQRKAFITKTLLLLQNIRIVYSSLVYRSMMGLFFF